jgi:hypothetical protein
VRVIAGESGGVRGPVEGIATRPLYLDVALEPGARFDHPLAPEDNALVYVFEGESEFGAPGRRLATGNLGILGEGDRLVAVATAASGRFLLLAARPLREPIARYGPFVMTTREELAEAVQAYQNGTFLD